MYEYEFRLVAACDEGDFDRFFEDARTFLDGHYQLFSPSTYRVFYVKPHFRMKEKRAPEWKKVVSTRAVYQEGMWFKFVESEEIPFANWSKQLTIQYLQNAGHYSHPVSVEFRYELTYSLFPGVKLYAFKKFENMQPRYGVVFEYEVGTYEKRQQNFAASLAQSLLVSYKRYYRFLRDRPLPHSSPAPFGGVRKPVVPLHPSRAKDLLAQFGSRILTAPKHDGTFGFVHCHADMLREVWEDNVHRVYPNVTLGNEDMVFGAERMPDGSVVLLDVYWIRGAQVRTTEPLLTEFLPRLKLPEGYSVQTYRVVDKTDRLFDGGGKEKDCDGVILHDVTSDVVYKLKSNHTIDLVHFDGFFWMPDGEKIRVPAADVSLRNGSVYECALDTFVPVRRRDDRFVGNSAEQISQLTSATFSNP